MGAHVEVEHIAHSGYASLSRATGAPKKEPMELYGRHRLKVGIPKEEEEKPRSPII
jgi:hypothetical protein